MKSFYRYFSLVLVFFILAFMTTIVPSRADNHADGLAIDVRSLQTCLKQENASLDVLVLMDSSQSLRDGKPGDLTPNHTGSDPKNRRGPILKSSLKLLQELAGESNKTFRINLKNFGKNSDEKSLKDLESKWKPWTEVTKSESERILNDFVTNALFNDSPGTEWAKGLATARLAFNERLNEATGSGGKSCSIMFWITDGVPSKPDLDKRQICSSGTESSIDWFRERNILVLGGLLKPKDEDSSLFAPIVEGENCGKLNKTWTRGSVIEATDINSLAWGFVSLIANLKNLINLGFDRGKVDLDPGTSKIEFFIKGLPSQWQINAPDGSVFCSSSEPKIPKCSIKADKDIEITTISVNVDPIKAEGLWSLAPPFPAGEVKVYGGLSVGLNPVKLVVLPADQNVSEGKKASFSVKLVNADGSLFDTSGFTSVKICATLDSNRQEVCKIGSGMAEFDLFPSESDSSVPFTAELVSKKDQIRRYNVSAVVNVTVQKSGQLPSLVCGNGLEGDLCKIPDLANKSKKESVQLKVLSPTEVGASSGQIYIVGFDITKDNEARNFNFVFTDSNGNQITPGDKNSLFTPGDKLNLEVSFDKGGESAIEGVIKYAVLSEGQTVVRQLDFGFQVGDKTNYFALILLMLIAYILTIALPYAFLLWSARRNAVLTVADNEFAYLEELVTISESGKVSSRTSQVENLIATTLDPSHESLRFETLEAGVRLISVSGVVIEVIPPQWNPFVEPVTHIYVKDNHVMSTYGGSEFYENKAFFTQSLTGEAIIYFPSEENLIPVSGNQNVMAESPSKSELFVPSAIKVQGDELVVKTGDILATALFLVPRYENRKKALNDVNSKLKSTLDSANLEVHINELRQTAFEAEQLRREELKKSNEMQTAKKKPTKEIKDEKKSKNAEVEIDKPSNRYSIIEEEIGTKEKGLFSDENETPDSNSGKKLWD